MFLKILASIVIAFAVIVVSGLSGLSFYVWPTGFNDHRLAVTPDVIQAGRPPPAPSCALPQSLKFGAFLAMLDIMASVRSWLMSMAAFQVAM